MATAEQRDHHIADSDIQKLFAESSSSTTKSSPTSFDENTYLADVDCIALTGTYLSFLLSYHKKALLSAFCLAGVLLLLGFSATTSYKAPTIVRDYSNIDSEFDLKVGLIDHWCLNGGDESCTCQDPLHPLSLSEVPGWTKARKKNKELIASAVASGKNIDVAFVGDALTELWAGRILGRDEHAPDEVKRIKKIFDKLFTKDGGGDFEGIPLGIAGDSAPQLLWRLLNGEMDGINPKVWWVEIGIGDLARRECSEEVVLLGILRIVEEIRKQKPSAKIVINGLIPTTKVRGGVLTDEIGKRFKRWTGKDLWPSINLINKNLQRFASRHTSIEYFDPMSVFVENSNRGQRIIKHFMRDPIHPNSDGYQQWGKAIVKRLKTMKGERNA